MAAPAPTRPAPDRFPALDPGVGRVEIGATASTADDVAAGAAQAVPRAIGAVAALTLLLLLPALFNRYPILFPDTADYLRRAQTLTPSPLRAFGYSAWIHVMSFAGTLWVPVVAQTLLLAAVLRRALRVFGEPTNAVTLGIGGALVIGTSAGWASSKAMPDVFTAVVILAIYLVVAHWGSLGASGRALVAIGLVVGGTMHLTNTLIGAIALIAMIALRALGSATTDARRHWILAAALLTLSSALLRGYEYLHRDDAEVAWNGDLFVLSHLVETGLAQQLLQERCATESFALCPVRDTLTRSAEAFVWRPKESPAQLVLHGDPLEIQQETSRIARGIIVHHPIRLLASVGVYTAEQLVTFRVNDDIWRHRKRGEVQYVIGRVLPADLAREQDARQQENTLRMPWTSAVHLIVFLAAAVFSAVTLRRAIKGRTLRLSRSEGFHVVVWVTLIANAAICANLASVFSRYQSRVSWLLPLAAAATLVEQGRLRRPVRRLTVSAAA